MRRYIHCRYCGTRNDRTGGRRKCAACRQPLPKRRVPKHAQTLRDDPYTKYYALNAAIHRLDFNEEACGVCGRPKPETRRHDRDHDHRTGQPRGLACVRCNRELLRNATLEEARLVVAYLERVEAFYAGALAAAGTEGGQG